MWTKRSPPFRRREHGLNCLSPATGVIRKAARTVAARTPLVWLRWSRKKNVTPPWPAAVLAVDVRHAHSWISEGGPGGGPDLVRVLLLRIKIVHVCLQSSGTLYPRQPSLTTRAHNMLQLTHTTIYAFVEHAFPSV